MILLQTNYTLSSGGSPNAVVYFSIGLGVVVVLLLTGFLIDRARRPRTPDDMAQYSRSLFRRTAASMGLPGPHIELFQRLVEACKLKQAFLVFSSASLLDDVLRKGMYSIENLRNIPDEEKERRKSILFEIKQILEMNVRKGGSLKSTHFLALGQALTLTPETGGHFPSKIVANGMDFLTVAAPQPGAKGGDRMMRGTRLSVYFWRENDAGYSFGSKVLGYDTVKGIASVLIQHGKALRREQRRRGSRKQIMRACFYYPIKVIETGEGRRTEKKASVESQLRALGTVVDLSAGGCAIQSMNPFEPGNLVMIEFDIDKKAPIRAFGKVKRVRRLKGRGGVMHVMFTRVTRQYLNRIRGFVYDFSRPLPSPPASTTRQPVPPGSSRSGMRPLR
jgi:c-di-GMP-binding flagellar brake protein YcgR